MNTDRPDKHENPQLMGNDTNALSFHTFVLLIDADNTSTDLFPQIMQKVETWGTITMRRVYGNQETLLCQKWKELCLHYALQPIPHVGISGAKNATDIALTVDAMDILWLYKEQAPNFCFVTGDQDFTALILRLRSQGCHAYCIGKPAKAEALAKVCTQFFPVEQLSTPMVIPNQKVDHDQRPAPAQKTSQSPLDPSLRQLLIQAAEKIKEEKNIKWIPLPYLGTSLKQLHPQFQTKTYGYKKLSALIESQTDLFEHRQQEMHLEVRLKKQKKKQRKKENELRDKQDI